MKTNGFFLAATLASAIGLSSEPLAKDKKMQQTTPAGTQLPIQGDLPSFGGATEWLNSQPLTAAGLRGKVVLVEFWTYTWYQLAADTPVRPRLGREIQESGI